MALIPKNLVQEAYDYDLLTYLHQRHYPLVKRGNTIHLQEHDSLKIFQKNNRWGWCWHSKTGPEGKKLGGGVVQFVMIYENQEWQDAVKQILDYAGRPVPEPDYLDRLKKQSPKKWYVPWHNTDNERVIRYLCEERKISRGIVDELIRRGDLYESKKYHNAVFVGRDELGKPRNIFMRATDMALKLEVPQSHKAYVFRMMGPSDTAYVLEAAIEALSHATMFELCGRDWRWDSRIPLGGTCLDSLDKALALHPHIKTVVACINNDPAGREAAQAICRIYAERGYNTRARLPVGNDFNHDLVYGGSWERRRQRALQRAAAPVR